MALTTVSQHVVSVNAIQGTLIADNAITAVHIATNAVSGTLIADNAVTATHIAQNTITVTQLADDAVEADKIADGVITTNHLNKAMISSQTEVTPVAGDFVLIGDTSDSNNLKKAPISGIVSLAATAADDISTGDAAVTIGTSSGDITLDSPADIILDADGGDINLKDGGTVFGNFSSANNDLNISTTAQDEDIVFQGNDGGSTITALTLDMSDAGAAIFNEKVGIGTTSPTAPLHIKTSTDDAYSLRIEGATNNSANYHGIGIAGESSNTKAAILFKDIGVSYSRGDMLFCLNDSADQSNATDSHAVMTLKHDGDIRIGTSSALITSTEVISVNNNMRGNTLALYTQGGASNFSIDMWNSVGGSCKQIQFRSGGSGAVVGSITSTGDNATQYNTSSDYRLKENVNYTWDATTKLKQLKPAQFNWITDENNTTLEGFLAHEVSTIVPQAVTGEKDATETITDLDGKEKTIEVYQGIDHSVLVPLLVKTIQELEERIKTLEG